MSYDDEAYSCNFSGDGTAPTFSSDADDSFGGAAVVNGDSQGSGWDFYAGGSSSGAFSGYTSDEYQYASPPPAVNMWIDQETTNEPLQMDCLDNPATHLEDVMDAAGGNVLGPFVDLPPYHGHAYTVSSNMSYPVPLPPSSYQPSVQAPSSVALPAVSPPSKQHVKHTNSYTARSQLPRSGQLLRQYAPMRSMSASSFEEINKRQWIVPQRLYRGNRGDHCQPDELFAVMAVNVSAEVALIPDALATSLTEPLEPAFGEASRKHKKWTYRYQFPDNPKPQNAAPQMHEYASGDQSSKAVDAAMRLPGSASKTSNSFATPLKRVAVVEKVAWGLAMYMNKLKDVGSPLKFNNREVDFNHLQIIGIFRPTPASMQPILEIREEFRGFYAYTS